MSYDFLAAFGPFVRGLAVTLGGSLDGLTAISLEHGS